jgi:tRNA-dihydrouridine synthase
VEVVRVGLQICMLSGAIGCNRLFNLDDTAEMAENFHRILGAAMDTGYAWATVHARTVAQKYIGPSRWDLLRDLVARERARRAAAGKDPPIIFGSGDIWEVADIFRMVAYTGVQAAAVARGCIGNPWIFRQAREMLSGRQPTRPTLTEQRAVMEEHFRHFTEIHKDFVKPESKFQLQRNDIRFMFESRVLNGALNVHYSLFISTLRSQASDEQLGWWLDGRSGPMAKCFFSAWIYWITLYSTLFLISSQSE